MIVWIPLFAVLSSRAKKPSVLGAAQSFVWCFLGTPLNNLRWLPQPTNQYRSGFSRICSHYVKGMYHVFPCCLRVVEDHVRIKARCVQALPVESAATPVGGSFRQIRTIVIFPFLLCAISPSLSLSLSLSPSRFFSLCFLFLFVFFLFLFLIIFPLLLSLSLSLSLSASLSLSLTLVKIRWYFTASASVVSVVTNTNVVSQHALFSW